MKSPWCAAALNSTAPSPTYPAFPVQHVSDGLLFSVMVDASLRPGLDHEHPAPHSGRDPKVACNRSVTFRPGRLGRVPIEVGGSYNANGR